MKTLKIRIKDKHSKLLTKLAMEVNYVFNYSNGLSPKGRAGLGIREWSCVYCGTVHDRDINAANNILATGHCRPVVGIHTS